MNFYDVLVVGGGAAGMGCALAAAEKGKTVLIAERGEKLGGVLNQCTHTGFGLVYFKENLTGVEYAERFIKQVERADIEVRLKTFVISVEGVQNSNGRATLQSPSEIYEVTFGELVLATGCRERTIYSLGISGTRPAGVMTCGMAQYFMNVKGLDVGDDIVILGTGDVGQIMAMQLKAAGKHVICMVEKENHPGGRLYNRKRCLEGVDVILSSTICRIYGVGRITGVRVRNLVNGEERDIACHTLLTALGLVPETDLLADCGIDPDNLPPWIRKAGNCDYVHDIVDRVSAEALGGNSSLLNTN